MENQNTQEHRNHNYFFNFASREMIANRKTAHETKQKLIEMGLSETEADNITFEVDSEISKVKRKQTSKQMLWGLFWCIIGIAITMITYNNASIRGGSYTVAYGAIIYGGFKFVWGFIDYAKS